MCANHTHRKLMQVKAKAITAGPKVLGYLESNPNITHLPGNQALLSFKGKDIRLSTGKRRFNSAQEYHPHAAGPKIMGSPFPGKPPTITPLPKPLTETGLLRLPIIRESTG